MVYEICCGVVFVVEVVCVCMKNNGEIVFVVVVLFLFLMVVNVVYEGLVALMFSED